MTSIREKHTKYKDPKDWLKYKQLRNEVNFEINVKKESYFSQKLQESKGDIKETWKVLNAASGRKSKTTVINSLEVESETISDPKKIAQKINHHFYTIADKVLAESEETYACADSLDKKDTSYYLSFIPLRQEAFKFKEITPEKIAKSISKMKNSKSGKIVTKFVKDTIEITAPMLSIIFNKSTKHGIFPKNLKIGKSALSTKEKAPNQTPITIDPYRCFL